MLSKKRDRTLTLGTVQHGAHISSHLVCVLVQMHHSIGCGHLYQSIQPVVSELPHDFFRIH